MKYFVEGLPKKQITVLKALGPHMVSKGFYLAGGTALSIHLEHRISVDLDWFTSQPIQDSLLLAQNLQSSGVRLEIDQVSAGTLRSRQHPFPVLAGAVYATRPPVLDRRACFSSWGDLASLNRG